jgi:hypothetical protein
MHTQRGALTFYEGPLDGIDAPREWIIIPFSSRCDLFGVAADEDWQGWLIAVQAFALSPRVRLFASSTNEFAKEGCGGIWGTAGVSVADNRQFYTVTGNGKFDGKERWACSVLRLGDMSSVADSYTARDWPHLFDQDLDLGGSSAVILPPLSTFEVPPGLMPPRLNVLATGAKDGRVYLVNGDAMGGVGRALWRRQLFSGSSTPSTDGIAVTPA